jgi:hypothetical protein
MRSIIVAGHSHTFALVGIGLHDIDYGDNAPRPHLLPVEGYDNVFGLHSGWPRPGDYWSTLMAHAAGNAVALVWGGNTHNTLFLLEQTPPFDFIYRGLPDLPLQEGAVVIPESQIRAKFLSYYSQADSTGLRVLLEALKAQPHTRIALVGTPPPNPDNDHLMSLLPVELPSLLKPQGMTEERLKLTSPVIRLKLWRVLQDLNQEEATMAGVEFVPVPDTVTDASGFLKPEFWGGDVTHANSAYGQVMLAHVAAMLADPLMSMASRNATSWLGLRT